MKCSKCNKDAVIYLPYSKQFLCKDHLSRLLLKRVGNNIRNYGMIKNRKRIGIAVSGGKDSLVMLYALHKLIGKDRRKELVVITIDEGIRDYRDKSIDYIKKAVDELNVEWHVRKFNPFTMDKIMELGKTNPCSYCGVFRRWELNKAAREAEVDALAIGHNLDDTVQTLFLNIMRNEPLRIARFTPNGGLIEEDAFVPRIRPMFNIPEKEIVVYALTNGIEFYNGECPYAGFALRNPIREFINDMENKYPGTKFKILNSYLSILSNMKIPSNLEIQRCEICGEPSSTPVCKRCQFINELKKEFE